MALDSINSDSLLAVDVVKKSFRVNRSAYRDPAVFEKEKQMIFSKCWLYLGHGSELKKNGDYVSRRVGGRDLVFVRDRKGEVRCYYNSCTHRGAKFCRDRAGNARTFACPYHGWVFNTEGKLVTTNADVGYEPDLNADGHLDLIPVPLLQDYRNFYFVNYNPKAIDLADYLADAKGVIDTICDQAETEQEVISGDHNYTIKGNYKLLCENSYDGYHLHSVHGSYIDFINDQLAGTEMEAKMKDAMKDYKTGGRIRCLGNGHGILESFFPNGRPVAQWLPFMGEELRPEIEASYQRILKKFGPERTEYITQMSKNAVIFPNLVLNDILATTIRVIEPEANDFMRVQAWALGPAEESPALRAMRLDNFISFLGPAGFGSPDDIEMLELCQQGAVHTPIEWSEISKGMEWVEDPRYETSAPPNEVHMQAYWHQWDRVMRNIDTLEKPD